MRRSKKTFHLPGPSAWVFSVIVGCLAVMPVSNSSTADDLADALTRHLNKPADSPLFVNEQRLRAAKTLMRFYSERGYRPAWSTGESTTAEALLGAIETSERHGLNPADYHLAPLRNAMDNRDRLAVELLATDAYLTLGAHLLGGRLNPVSIEPDWTADRRERDLAATLTNALSERRITASLDELAPHSTSYRVLMEALAIYRQAAATGAWSVIESGAPLKVGDSSERVRSLRRRLQVTGLLAPEEENSGQFDNALETAVAAFQRRIGLEADGVVGPVTLRELNKGPSVRVAQIRANLERWRWLPEDLGSRHIRVNIADYRLEAHDNGRVEQVHDVIVGRTYRKTPVFSGQLAYVVLNPWWETPHNLARLDKLPAFRKDPATVEKLGFEILDGSGRIVDPGTVDWSVYSEAQFPFRLRQRPGPLNALGRVKLMFPNKHNVYLHDTPSQELFVRNERAFSSGCVRVSDALGLTGWVLAKSSGWSRERIDTVVASGKETRVDLSTKIPVHILYFTAVADADGSLRLINDIYQRDARLSAALSSPPPTTP